MNRLATLRLTERCSDILISVREEIVDAGYTVTEELHAPIAKLNEYDPRLHTLRYDSLVPAGRLPKFCISSQSWAIVLSSSAT